MNYYNEHDPKAAAWLRALIQRRCIPNGYVDERSISDVLPEDLVEFTQCHFFAGIGGWPLALQIAGWPCDRPVWTGSCPCQPFSLAGRRTGERDERHLWPQFRRLIAERSPPTVFGEQVASALGRKWFSGVRVDLETLGYAVGGADLCAAGVGAPHIRQRIFWGGVRLESTTSDGGMADARSTGLPEREGHGGIQQQEVGARSREAAIRSRDIGFWNVCSLVPCRDGKSRRVEPGTYPLANGFPGRVGLLRGYGNAIVPQLAAEFVEAWVDTE